MAKVSFTINGTACTDEIEDHLLLAEYLRYTRGLTGTHVACDTTQCGACTVTLNGDAVKSCTVLAAQVSGATIQTVEGLQQGTKLHPVQEAFVQCHALQCGFCTPGMIMSIEEFVRKNAGADLSDEDIAHALEGNICRCTGYVNIVKAVRHAAAALATEGAPR
jgi:carbon-monoxide dehydrogenase small subunit